MSEIAYDDDETTGSFKIRSLQSTIKKQREEIVELNQRLNSYEDIRKRDTALMEDLAEAANIIQSPRTRLDEASKIITELIRYNNNELEIDKQAASWLKAYRTKYPAKKEGK